MTASQVICKQCIDMKNIDQFEFEGLSQEKDSVILDVRRPDEWARGIVPGARTINFMDQLNFMDEIQKLDKSKHYLIYCRSGNRSGRACMIMNQLGFGNTYNLKGGMMAWRGELV